MNAITIDRDIEPLVRSTDLDEYADALKRHLSGQWDDEKWTAFRVRYGVYGQKQPGVQMIRIKIPGGILPLAWVSVVAEFNRRFCQGDAHITTRQDFQLYFVPLAQSAEALGFLYAHGMTTREACGNTFRNITSCALAGNCPREHVDAGLVADRLARSWLRQPLVQHMPRKAKIAISGCATDCAGTTLHDLGFIAVEKEGRQGFAVLVGGGLGSMPKPALKVLDFIPEEELATALEAMARLHQRYSDRINRNTARIKYVVKRFGDDKFRQLFTEEFERLRGLPQRPWQPLAWRRPDATAKVERTPLGVVPQHDGRFAIVANPVLGNLSAAQLDELVEIAKAAGMKELRLTRDQNLLLPDIAAEHLETVVSRLKAIDIDVPVSAAQSTDIVSCPGTTTCRIGITNSPGLARTVWEDSKNDPSSGGIAVRISGCQNSCGQHHIGDFGFHGLAKKIDGKPAPHYQIHIGGEARFGAQAEMAGIGGPIIPARLAPRALRLLRQGYAEGKQKDETVRLWAERLGKDGINNLLANLDETSGADSFLDWGDSESFKGAPTLRGECAAPFASDDLLADLADDALIRFDRNLAVKRWEPALQSAEEAVVFAARRLLHHAGQFTKDEESAAIILARVHEVAQPRALAALDHLSAEKTAALSNGRVAPYREAVAVFLDTVRAVIDPDTGGKDAAE
ncbi:MAG TPA: nitrite/sulfite reductase [Rhodospirillaceae bacterium]|nr:nitrite/sulfite reductase [Rhodospirillaceae bacterium]